MHAGHTYALMAHICSQCRQRDWCMHAHSRACTRLCREKHAHALLQTNTGPRIHTRIHIHAHWHTHKRTCARANAHSNAHMYTRTRTLIYFHRCWERHIRNMFVTWLICVRITYRNTKTHGHTKAQTRAYTHTFTPAYVYTQKDTHAHICTHAQSQTHTQTKN